jgi:hypothetical protein
MTISNGAPERTEGREAHQEQIDVHAHNETYAFTDVCTAAMSYDDVLRNVRSALK